MTTDLERRQRAQIRNLKQGGWLQQRMTGALRTGLVPYAAAVGLGYVAETDEAKGQIAILAATAGGLLGQAILNPKRDSVADVVLGGLAASGASLMGIEHGRVVCRMKQARSAIKSTEQADTAGALHEDTRDEADVVNIPQEATA